MFSLAKKIRNNNVQMAVIMRSGFSEALLCSLAKIKYKIGYKKNGRSWLLSHSYKLNSNHHYINRYCRLVNEPHNNPFSASPLPYLFSQKSELIETTNKPVVVVYYGGVIKKQRHYPSHQALKSLAYLNEMTPVILYLSEIIKRQLRIIKYQKIYTNSKLIIKISLD